MAFGITRPFRGDSRRVGYTYTAEPPLDFDEKDSQRETFVFAGEGKLDHALLCRPHRP